MAKNKKVNVCVTIDGCCEDTCENQECNNIVIPYGQKIVFRNEANQESDSCEPLEGEIFMGYHEGKLGEYRIENGEVKTITRKDNS